MKKTYIEPSVKEIVVSTIQVFAGSLEELGNEITSGNVDSDAKDESMDFDW